MKKFLATMFASAMMMTAASAEVLYRDGTWSVNYMPLSNDCLIVDAKTGKFAIRYNPDFGENFLLVIPSHHSPYAVETFLKGEKTTTINVSTYPNAPDGLRLTATYFSPDDDDDYNLGSTVFVAKINLEQFTEVLKKTTERQLFSVYIQNPLTIYSTNFSNFVPVAKSFGQCVTTVVDKTVGK